MSDTIWRDERGCLLLMRKAKEMKRLENAVYGVSFNDRFGFYLERVFAGFEFDYKVYGIESDVINRIIKTYTALRCGNLGVLFNGIKGTGKTVSAKLLCNRLEQPVIIVDKHYPGVESFINSIPQDVTVFVDEYEKVFEKSNDMLTIMDGVMNAEYRRMFILTTNKLYVEDNMIQRPSRIRYLKEFTHLAPKLVEEIVDDVLAYPQHRQACIEFISSLQIITVDIVKSVLQEVNIHDEPPSKFESVFNVQKNTGKYDVFVKRAEDAEYVKVVSRVSIYPRPRYDADCIGCRVEINGDEYGTVIDVTGPDTIRVTQYDYDEKGNRIRTRETFDVRVDDAYIYHYNYGFSDGHSVNVSESEDARLKMGFASRNESAKIMKLRNKSVVGVKVKTENPCVDIQPAGNNASYSFDRDEREQPFDSAMASLQSGPGRDECTSGG